MLYFEIIIEINEELINKITQKCSVESLRDDKQKTVLLSLNTEARKYFGENENKALYFADFSEKEITAVPEQSAAFLLIIAPASYVISPQFTASLKSGSENPGGLKYAAT